MPDWHLLTSDEAGTIREHRTLYAQGMTFGGLRQLALCAREYGCYTAQNIFYRRWEGAIPASPRCAAQCVGCISEQLGEVASPQDRLPFAPTPEEIVEVAVPHLQEAEQAMIS